MIDLIGKKYYFFALSFLLIVTGIVGYINHGGFNLDIQFEGGTILEVKLNDKSKNKDQQIERINMAKETLKKSVNKPAVVQITNKIGENQPDILMIQLSKKHTLKETERIKLVDALIKDFQIKAPKKEEKKATPTPTSAKADNKTTVTPATTVAAAVTPAASATVVATVPTTPTVANSVTATPINTTTLAASPAVTPAANEGTTVVASKNGLATYSDVVVNLESVDPFIGRELLINGLWSIFWASILIVLYIWVRFKVMSGLSAGVMAVIALLHDAALMLAVYTVFNVPLNESFIAAVLTILGYSMNDTIIIYDRIRENSSMLKKVPVAELVNRSIIQTLARSINTVLTVVICVVTAYAFAHYYHIEPVKEFTFPLIVGIISGCYSSIFIASPLWVMWREFQDRRKAKARAVAKGSKA